MAEKSFAELIGAGPCKVVERGDVEPLTLHGWQLVSSYQEETPSYGMEQEAATGPNTYPGQVNNLSRYRPSTRTYFVLHKAESSALGAMAQELDDLRAQLTKSYQAQAEGAKAAEVLKSDLAVAKRSAEGLEEQRARAAKQRDALEASKRKLEEDLAKVKRCIGERAYNEALADAPTSTTPHGR
jgi:hypothetical protein